MVISNIGMSKDMYQFILENKEMIKKDLNKGVILTPKGTNGTVCSYTGYLRVKVNKKVLQVHQVLAVEYFGEKCIGMTVNHIDGDKLNNKKENLEMISRSDNVKHQWESGLAFNRGKEMRKLSEDDVRYIRDSHVPFKRTGENTLSALAEKFGVSKSTIKKIVNRVTYKDIE